MLHATQICVGGSLMPATVDISTEFTQMSHQQLYPRDTSQILNEALWNFAQNVTPARIAIAVVHKGRRCWKKTDLELSSSILAELGVLLFEQEHAYRVPSTSKKVWSETLPQTHDAFQF